MKNDGACARRLPRVIDSCRTRPHGAGAPAALRAKKSGGARLDGAPPSGKKSRLLPTLPQADPAVPSATRPLTSVFGTGTGVASASWKPGKEPARTVRGQPAGQPLGPERRGEARRLSARPRASGQACRRISAGRLSASRRLHPPSIEVVFSDPPSRADAREALSRGSLGA